MNTPQENIPDTVYHYCSVDTFHSIITNKSLRLCDIQKSNDSKELIEIYENIIAYLNLQYGKANSTVTKIQLASIQDILSSDSNDTKNIYHSICFSEFGDDLNQWRGYADDAKGVSIGINTKMFPIDSYLLFNRIMYNFDEIVFMDPIFQKCLKEDALDSGDNVCDFISHIIDTIYDNICFVKNKYFKSENEYRLSINSDLCSNLKFFQEKINSHTYGYDSNDLYYYLSHPLDDDNYNISNINFMSKNNKLISYRDVTFKKPDNKPYNFINKIYLGPKCALTREDVYLFLISNDIDIDFDNIVMSEGSYR